MIVTDYDMPGLSTHDALKFLKEGIKSMILISALKIKEEIKREFDSFLQKPIEREIFIKELAFFLKHTTQIFKKNKNADHDDFYELNIPKEITKEQKELISKIYEKFVDWRTNMELTAIEIEIKKIKKIIKKSGLNEVTPF